MRLKKSLALIVPVLYSTLCPPAGAAIRLDLDAMAVIGNQELPRVVYIMAWQNSPKGDILQQTLESLHKKEIMPIDRDVFRRQVEYYELLHNSD